MEVLRKKLCNDSTNFHNQFSGYQQFVENTVGDIAYKFLDTTFNILSKYDLQILSICETVRYFFFIFDSNTILYYSFLLFNDNLTE